MKNFKVANTATGPSGVVAELAAGAGPCAAYVADRWQYVGLDISRTRDTFKGKAFFIGDVHKPPFKTESIDVLITISSLQYFKKDEFFSECESFLKPSGLLLLHENGPFYPFILGARLAQRVIGLVSRKHWLYRNAIRGYCRLVGMPRGFIIEARGHVTTH